MPGYPYWEFCRVHLGVKVDIRDFMPQQKQAEQHCKRVHSTYATRQGECHFKGLELKRSLDGRNAQGMP